MSELPLNLGGGVGNHVASLADILADTGAWLASYLPFTDGPVHIGTGKVMLATALIWLLMIWQPATNLVDQASALTQQPVHAEALLVR